jgi:predicted metal-dependent phosphoesterase TrpH
MPNTTCDLHMHSYYSDGCNSPADLLHYAADMGLKTLALTDHDTLAGLAEAQNVAGKLGLELIPGVELTTTWEGGASAQIADVLGYFFDPVHPRLVETCRQARQDFDARVFQACRALADQGIYLSFHELLDQNPRYPGPGQMIQALIQNGQAADWMAGYTLYQQVWSQIPLPRLKFAEGIAAIHAAGGVAVLAHPVSVRGQSSLLGADELAQMVAAGLDGLETEHPRLNAVERAHFRALADKFNLTVSGGSDEHGWNGGFTRMGSELVTYAIVNELQRRSAFYLST